MKYFELKTNLHFNLINIRLFFISIRLSAFVIKTFHQAKKHVFIDDKTQVRAITWMQSKQAPDGSFLEPGRVIHKDMQVSIVRVKNETGYISLKIPKE